MLVSMCALVSVGKNIVPQKGLSRVVPKLTSAAGGLTKAVENLCRLVVRVSR